MRDNGPPRFRKRPPGRRSPRGDGPIVDPGRQELVGRHGDEVVLEI